MGLRISFLLLSVSFLSFSVSSPSFSVSSLCFAATAVIKGPESVEPGDFFVLDGEESIGDQFQWVIDPRLSVQTIQCKSSLATAIKEEGTFFFMYIAVDDSISVATHILVVGPSSPLPPPVLPPPPPADLDKLIEISANSAPKDEVTAKRLSSTLRKVPLLPLEEMKLGTLKLIDSVLLTREDKERVVNWMPWREAINKAMEELSPSSPTLYRDGLEALAKGLDKVIASSSSSSSSVLSPVVLYYYSTTNCPGCEKWEKEVMPYLSYKVIKASSPQVKSFPSFQFEGEGIMLGYKSLNELKR